jgi:hypothetical protein
MLALAQTLHGYDQGHRLLSSSGDLDERELALLERLSDLSGYLPPGTRFDSYFTGFPCGRYYAVASTWLDVTATRAGTVLTHTLLIPMSVAISLEDFWSLTPLHRRPQGAGDRQSYREPLSLPALPAVRQVELPLEEATAAVVLLWGTEDRPILWVDDRQPEAVARFLWGLLRPEQRQRFAFCTLAFQPRTVEGRPFDFLGLPPAARGSFLERAGSEAWWDTKQLRHERLLGLTQQGWAQAIAQRGPSERRRLEGICISSRLPLPAPKDLPVFWRFVELEAAAAERLPAARSRADLFERLWPGLAPTHPAADPILRALLDRQSDAALEPRPLWELTDFLKRPLVRGRRTSDTVFASQVDQVLEAELERRFAQVPTQTLQGLPEFLDASGARGTDSLLRVIQRVLATAPDAAERLAPQLLEVAETLSWIELIQTGLAALSPLARQRALKAVPSVASREPLLQLVEQTAEHLGDFELVLLTGKLRGREQEALQRITRLLAAQGQGTLKKVLESLRPTMESSLILAWALEASEPNWLAWYAAEAGAQAAKSLGLSLNELVRRCGGSTNGARLLLVLATLLERVEPLEQALRQVPMLARDVLVLSLREEWDSRTSNLTRVALELISDEQLLTPELLQMLRSYSEQWRTRELMRRVGPQWLRAVYSASLPDQVLADWLSVALLRQWLWGTTSWQLRTEARVSEVGDLLPGLCRVLRRWLDTQNPYDIAWVPALLEGVLDKAGSRNLDEASEDLTAVLRHLSRDQAYGRLAAKVLAFVSRTSIPSGWRLVEQVFPRVYAAALRDEPSLFGVMSAVLTGKGWDKAKPLRRWLIEAYVDHRWPPESLLRCLDGDVGLFFKLAHRAARSRKGAAFLERLPSALEAAPELASRWRRPIEDALDDPHRVTDSD